jgi:NAD(P) transhydrogenase subunit alpha
MLIAVTADNLLGYVLAFVAAAFAAMNVVGGYVVTGRMLKMFRRRPAVPAAAAAPALSGGDGAEPAGSRGAADGAAQ